MTVSPVGIAYVDGPRLRRSILAAADWVDAARDELNRINVFPVPDGDTGTNFAMTLRAVASSVRQLDERASLAVVTKTISEASVLAAHGNSGILLSQFLLGFGERLSSKASADAADVAAAIRAGADRLSESLDEPVEGTILTVSREVADAAEQTARASRNFEDLMRGVLDQAQGSLARTPELLKVLKDAGVVDAGAKAFVLLLEGIVRFIEGDPIVPVEHPQEYTVPAAAALAEVAVDRDYRFCTEVLVRGAKLPPTTVVRAALRPLGGSIVVLHTGELLKVHIHTNSPDRVFALAEGWGTLEATKADDMREQHRALQDVRRRIALVVDSSCDLADETIDEHGMVVIPIQVIEGDKTYLDRIGIRRDELYRRMGEGAIFTTSQPTPAAFVQGFEDALSVADDVVAVLLAKALSGTFASGQAAAKLLGGRITLVDSRSTSLGLGLLALRAGWAAGAPGSGRCST